MTGSTPTRRQAIVGLGAAAVAWCCGDHLVTEASTASREPADLDVATSPLVDVASGLAIHPRAEWGADLPPRGAIGAEDVKFLLVHHSASDFNTSNPRSVIRSIYAFHTGPEKRWQDVAYNFFVAPDGSVWEGRAGSLDGPVEASATGGSQGFAQLVCLLGNHVSTPPTGAAQASLVRVLAWLAGRYQLNTYADASTTFV